MDQQTQCKTIIVGLGKTGLSCARYFAAQGIDVMVVDAHSEPPLLAVLQRELPQVVVQLGQLDADLLSQAELLVLSPGVSLAQPAIADAVANGVSVVGDIELFARVAKAPVVAITGSNGKSTVTTMVYEMARQAGLDARVGGNIGTPVLDLLQDCEPDLYVLELSSFQLETTSSLNAEVAVVLNVSQDHLDRYASMKDYIAAKERIYRGAKKVLLNIDTPLDGLCSRANHSALRFGLTAPVSSTDFGLRHQQGETWLARGSVCLMPMSELKVAGSHNVSNALAALALGDSLNIPMASMLDALRQFKGLPHRCQWLAESDQGVVYYDDSKATNVGAAVAAIMGMEGKLVLIAGGQSKRQDFAPLRAAVAAKARAVILIGQDAPSIKAALADSVPVKFAANLDEAVMLASAAAEPGDAVLLSPACASFDMFSGYQDRGEQFAASVMRAVA